jgi:hypothetical protein
VVSEEDDLFVQVINMAFKDGVEIVDRNTVLFDSIWIEPHVPILTEGPYWWNVECMDYVPTLAPLPEMLQCVHVRQMQHENG